MDLVYILGSGSKWNDNELRYSLRSVEKNLSGFNKIWIVGKDPGFTKGIEIIEYPDELGPKNADGNITRKLIRVCQEQTLSETFIKMNDDYIINRTINVNAITPLNKGDMTEYPKAFWRQNFWRQRLKRTLQVLQSKGLTTINFEYHAPIPMSKLDFTEIVESFDFEKGIGYTTRSIYGNKAYKISFPLTYEEKTIFNPHKYDELLYQTVVPIFIAYNDSGLNEALKLWLDQSFPNPSKWEN